MSTNSQKIIKRKKSENWYIAELFPYIFPYFKDDDKIPIDSPIGNTNRTDIESKISELENQKNEIQTEIEKLLREQSSR